MRFLIYLFLVIGYAFPCDKPPEINWNKVPSINTISYDGLFPIDLDIFVSTIDSIKDLFGENVLIPDTSEAEPVVARYCTKIDNKITELSLFFGSSGGWTTLTGFNLSTTRTSSVKTMANLCKSSKKNLNTLSTSNGLKLGITKSRLVKILGEKFEKVGPNHLAYKFNFNRIDNNLNTNAPKKNSTTSLQYDVTLYLEACFIQSRLSDIKVSATETN